ncbi:hypothetical protein HDU76_011973 [Blyttiomyces sp. JEL0837]|nr:hypothetical protein HDU76_011973 [Blyttiomyces sp. JEL0837]
MALVRQELGQDIDSACGQLVIKSLRKGGASGCDSESEAGSGVGDLEDLVKGGKGNGAGGGLGKKVGRSSRRKEVGGDSEGGDLSRFGKWFTPSNVGVVTAVVLGAVFAYRVLRKIQQ